MGSGPQTVPREKVVAAGDEDSDYSTCVESGVLAVSTGLGNERASLDTRKSPQEVLCEIARDQTRKARMIRR